MSEQVQRHRRIEDYALIGDLVSAALVDQNGSIDWLCVPRIDSPACFARLLGSDENGFWRISASGTKTTSRHYRDDSLVLETTFETDTGRACVVDCMPLKNTDNRTRLVRLVRGLSGSVTMEMEIVIRFDYGSVVPWVRRKPFGLTALSGANALQLESRVPLEGHDFRTHARFEVSAGEEVPFVLTYHSSVEEPPVGEDAAALCRTTDNWWREWTAVYEPDAPDREAVVRSLITLKALTHQPSGGLIAAPTTSLPEWPGHTRNWDYRYCWLRDATFTLYALLISGCVDEAQRWQEWLLRAAAGKPSQLQAIFGPAGERLLPEFEVSWLSGFAASQPVRVGNAAYQQFQLDVYGEIMDVLHLTRRYGVGESEASWALQRQLVKFLETEWLQPDNGIWEVRGPRRHFTHSKVMAWVAFDRAVKAVERSGLEGPLDHWRKLRNRVHQEVCEKGFSSERGAFVQSFGSKKLDASLLMMPLVGFLPPTDSRVVSTVKAIEQELNLEGFVRRYEPDDDVEGFSSDEATFLPCTFWLADCYALMGSQDKARRIFDRLLDVRNDLGLLAEEYDPVGKRLLGNFPQAFSHVSLINTAHNLTHKSPAAHRSESA